MSKKIGCVICYTKNHNNYGTSLQAYAMLKKIQDMGFDLDVINYVKCLTFIEKLKYVWNAFRCGELKKVFRNFTIKKNAKQNPSYAHNLRVRTDSVNAYKKVKIEPLLKNYVGYERLHMGSKRYDAVVVGSDQVWTPLSLPNKFFNLLFVDDSVKKIAYASSFGVADIPAFQKKQTGKYLDRFSIIGVREMRGKEIVESLSHKKATVVADPTLLLTRSEWEKEIESSSFIYNEPYIFCYIISENVEARHMAEELGKTKHMKLVVIRHMEQYRSVDEFFGDEAPYDVNPNDFVKLISNAEYVVTDSFHCSVFSIIFHRKFMTFYRSLLANRNSKNSRIDSLFEILGVSKDHIYSGDVLKIDSPIEWNAVEANLTMLRNNSIQFLKQALC